MGAAYMYIAAGWANLGADIVEEELASGGAANVDSASKLDHLFLVGFAILEVGELFFEVANVVRNMILVVLVVARC